MSRRYHLYISHSFSHAGALAGLEELLGRLAELEFQFHYLDFADPLHRDPQTGRLEAAVRAEMRGCDALLCLGGVFSRYARWLNIETTVARGELFSRRPVIFLHPWADIEPADAEKEAADLVVPWSAASFRTALFELCGSPGPAPGRQPAPGGRPSPGGRPAPGGQPAPGGRKNPPADPSPKGARSARRRRR